VEKWIVLWVIIGQGVLIRKNQAKLL